MKTVVRGGELVTASASCRRDILIEGGRIAAVGLGLNTVGAQVIEAQGCLVFPGFIDAHTHFDLEVGGTVTADDFRTGTKAALAGGTTTVIDFATQAKGGSLAQALDRWQEKAAGLSACDYAFHLAITDWNQETAKEVKEMARAGVTSYKVYLAYDDLRLRDGQVWQVLGRVKEVGGIVGAHCENGDVVDELVREHLSQRETEPRFHPLSRPELAEAEAVSRFTCLAQMAGTPAYIVHLSSAAGLAAALAARERGAEVYLETCPQYLFLDDALYDLPGFEGAKYVCSPPLRGQASQAALWAALAAGRLDTVATDHCSFNYRGQKELGRADFSKIPNGLPGVEHRPTLLYTAVANGTISANRFVALLAENPARLFGLYPQKGTIAPGSDADLVLWDPEARDTIRAKNQEQNVDYTPYEGFKTRGGPRAVLLGGELAFSDGRLLLGNRGRYLPRCPGDFYRKG